MNLDFALAANRSPEKLNAMTVSLDDKYES